MLWKCCFDGGGAERGDGWKTVMTVQERDESCDPQRAETGTHTKRMEEEPARCRTQSAGKYHEAEGTGWKPGAPTGSEGTHGQPRGWIHRVGLAGFPRAVPFSLLSFLMVEDWGGISSLSRKTKLDNYGCSYGPG